MKATDVRIGNIVKSLNEEVEYCIIESITKTRITGTNNNTQGRFVSKWNSGSDFFQGLPLTEKWLTKLGFSKITTSHDLALGNFRWNSKTGLYYERETESDVVEIDLSHIEHVHEFQNCYFAITGDEPFLR
ncbi:hypothetical protein [Hufsiella ginkgonis]|uniref:Uncharacterized protein n=1 Tax=Hufsiella ginkgonis TaxID=2695274 RepID=A0A7K1Y1E2_9SPHI|nr:hypothetical protein [Hufsiella ginkgonis]MXV16839.1 hypothetical protein [Hufsiella ginkgonis]